MFNKYKKFMEDMGNTTPKYISFLKKNYFSNLNNNNEYKDEKKKKVILLTTGALNPVHRMHLEIFKIAAEHLVSFNQNFEILCGLLSPSSHEYVKYKDPPTIPFDLRCKMVNSAIEEYSTEFKEFPLFVHSWEGSLSYFMDFPLVRKHIQQEVKHHFPNEDIIVLYVCGIDHVFKCGLNRWNNVIGIDRQPYSENFDTLITDPNVNRFFFKDTNAKPLSSTLIRELLAKGDQESLDKIKEITFNSVTDMIINFWNDYCKNKIK